MDDGAPRRPEALQAPWLTGALQAAGVADGATVEQVELEGDIGTGQAARSVRYRLEWDRPEGRPGTLVGKFPAEDDAARSTLAATGGYWKEWLFYTDLASTVDLRVPSCHVARFDPATSDFVLLMEDLSAAVQGDQLDGLSEDELALAVDQAAALHGPRFGDTSLEPLLSSGSGSLSAAEAGPFCEEMYGVALVGFLERFADRLSPGAVDTIERTGRHVAAWFRGTGTPATLIHFDLRADNLLFDRSGVGPPIVVVDFQAVTAGVGATDLAYLLGGSVADAEVRAAIEADLLERYRTRLSGFGVELSTAEVWRDYRHGSLWGLIMTVLSSLGTVRTDRGDEMFVAMAERHARHVLDLDALAFVR